MQTEIKEINGLKFHCRTDNNDYEVLKSELSDNFYELNGYETILDIGAHVGGTAIMYANRGAEVWSYEPEFETFKVLEMNVKLNGLEDKIHIFNYGIGTPGKRKLCKQPGNSGMSSMWCNIERVRNRKGRETIDVKSFSSILKRKFDALKFDCEGCEYEFLSKLTKAQADKINYITGELHFKEYHQSVIENLQKYYNVTSRPPLDCETANRTIYAKRK